MIKISFVIPVYNSQDTLEAAVKSIITYPLEELEVILVDDGSTDESLSECRRMAAIDSRISVYHKENEGMGLTRNYGIDRAVGKYIFFLDSDDKALMSGIDALLKKAEKLEADGSPCDIIQGFYYRVLDSEKELVGEKYPNGWIRRNGAKEEVKLYNSIKTESAFGYSTNKLYRREFINKYGIRFCPRLIMEDQIFNLELWSHDPAYYIENKPVFEYWLRSRSISHGGYPIVADNSVKVLELYYDYLVKSGFLQENLDLLIPLAMRLFCWSLVKNIPYEKSNLDTIQSQADLFLSSEAFKFIISDRKHKKELRKLPSFLQRIFFDFCFTCAGWSNGRFIAIIMKMGSPIFSLYISDNVK